MRVAPGRVHVAAGVTDAAPEARKPSYRTVEAPTSTVAVVCAAIPRAARSDQAAACSAARELVPSVTGRALRSTRARFSRRSVDANGGRGSRWRADGDVALHRAAEIHEILVACRRREGEHRCGRGVDRNAARDQA